MSSVRGEATRRARWRSTLAGTRRLTYAWTHAWAAGVLASAAAGLASAGAGCGGIVSVAGPRDADADGGETLVADAGARFADAASPSGRGTPDWSVAFSVHEPLGFCVASSSGGAVAVAMETTSTTGEDDPFQLDVRYYDAGGALRWAQTIADRPQPFAGFSPVCSLAFDGEDVIVGARRERDDTQNAPLRAFFARLDASDGHTVWSTTLGDAEMVDLTPVLVVRGTLFAAGTTMNGTTGLPSDPAPATNAEAFVLAYDAKTGALERSAVWSAAVPQTTFEAIGLRPDGDLALVGSFVGSTELAGADGKSLAVATTAAGAVAFLARYSIDLTAKSAALLPPPLEPIFGRVAFDTSGGFAAASSPTQTMLARFDSEGGLVGAGSFDDPRGPGRNVSALAVVSTGEAILPFGDGVSAFGPTAASVGASSYPGAAFGGLAPTSDGRVAATGLLSSSVDFGTGMLVPADAGESDPTVFVARGHLW